MSKRSLETGRGQGTRPAHGAASAESNQLPSCESGQNALREARLAQIRSSIAAGIYRVNTKHIASKLMDRMTVPVTGDLGSNVSEEWSIEDASKPCQKS